MSNWTSCTFFGPRAPTPEIENLNDFKITAASECHNKVLFGTEDGEVYLAMSPHFPAQKTDLKCPSPVLHIIAAEYSQRAMIVFKGIEDSKEYFFFQVYNMSDFSALYEIIVPSEGRPDISFLSCSGKLSRFAFTIDQRQIYEYSLPSSDKAIEKIQRLSVKPEIKKVKEGTTITGMFLANDEKLNRYLYVLTNAVIQCYDIDKKGALRLKWTINEAYNPQENQQLCCVGTKGRLYVCRDKLVTVYVDDDAKNNITFELIHSPSKMFWFRQYLVCLSPKGDDVFNMTIYEPSTFITFASRSIPYQFRFLLNEWSGLTLILFDAEENKTLIQIFDEPSTEEKVQKLCTKFSQFDVALKIAQKNNLSLSVIASIHKTKGDKSYTRKNFEAAIDEYIETIGFLEPSYVIKKFLDPQHANHLIRYLEELQIRDQEGTSASSDSAKKLHSTLLFNCYAKLRKEEILTEKVQNAIDSVALNEEAPFDVDSAIDVLTHSGYASLAHQLADAFGKHETCMKILYDSGDWKCLFEHFGELTGAQAFDTIKKYGSYVLSQMKNDNMMRHKFIHLAIDLCIEEQLEPLDPKVYNAECFKTVFSLDTQVYHHFLEGLCKADPAKLTETLWNDYVQTTLLNHFQDLPSVIDHPDAKYSTKQVLILLQEQYIKLKDIKRKYDDALKANRQDDPAVKVDINSIVAALENVNKSLITIFKKRKVYTEILNCIPPEQIASSCETYATESKDNHFWLEGLREAERRNKGPFIKDIVHRIHENDLYPINSLLKTRNGFSEFTFDIFQDLVKEDFTKMQEMIKAKQKELNTLEEQIERDSIQVQNLTKNYHIIKPVNCEFCKLPIDQTSYHFFCGHSYHKNCLENGAEICRVCKGSHVQNSSAKIKQIEEAKELNSSDMLKKLKTSKNPQESLNMLLEGGFFDQELRDDTALQEFAKRLNH